MDAVEKLHKVQAKEYEKALKVKVTKTQSCNHGASLSLLNEES